MLPVAITFRAFPKIYDWVIHQLVSGRLNKRIGTSALAADRVLDALNPLSRPTTDHLRFAPVSAERHLSSNGNILFALPERCRRDVNIA